MTAHCHIAGCDNPPMNTRLVCRPCHIETTNQCSHDECTHRIPKKFTTCAQHREPQEDTANKDAWIELRDDVLTRDHHTCRCGQYAASALRIADNHTRGLVPPESLAACCERCWPKSNTA